PQNRAAAGDDRRDDIHRHHRQVLVHQAVMSERILSERDAGNRRMLTRLSIVAVGMFGFGFALVPFYDHICRALGVNSLVERAELPANTQVDLTRKITIEFDANAHGMPWRFQPTVRHLEVHPGQMVHLEYEVATAWPVTGLLRTLATSYSR